MSTNNDDDNNEGITHHPKLEFRTMGDVIYIDIVEVIEWCRSDTNYDTLIQWLKHNLSQDTVRNIRRINFDFTSEEEQGGEENGKGFRVKDHGSLQRKADRRSGALAPRTRSKPGLRGPA